MLGSKERKFKNFNEWCLTDAPVDRIESFDIFKETGGAQRTSPEKYSEVIQNINTSLNDGKTVNFQQLNRIAMPEGNYIITGRSKTDLGSIGQFLYHSVTPDQLGRLCISNVRIKRALITWKAAPTLKTPIVFENCEIAELILEGDARVSLKNSCVGTMEITKAHHLDMRGGCVLNILVPAPEMGNPFTGSITFTDTFFPENRKDYLLEGPQPYRNMRHHLNAIENAQMGNKFHSLELAVEREDDTLANRIFSNLYKAFSDYGASTLLPIGWWAGIWLLFSVIIFTADGAVRGNSDDSIYTGWKTAFLVHCDDMNVSGVLALRPSSHKHSCGDTTIKRLKRSAYLSTQTMLNPLGIFSTKNVATTSTGWMVPFLLLQGFLSAVFIALMIFAIRRRFKMQ